MRQDLASGTARISEKMKKTLLLSIVLILPALAFALAISNSSQQELDAQTKEITYSLVKGWNFIPLSLNGQMTENTSIENRCHVDNILATFIWDSTEAKYFGWADASDISSPTGQQIEGRNGPYESWQMYYDKYQQLLNLAQQGNAFVSNGAGFFYSKDSCKLKFKFENAAAGKKLSKNANTISISQWMIGKSPKSIFSNCLIEKINTWDSTNQKWALSAEEMDSKAKEFQNDENPLGENLLGIPFIIYVNDACEMK